MKEDVLYDGVLAGVYLVTDLNVPPGWATVSRLDATCSVPLGMLGEGVQLGWQVLLSVSGGDLSVEVLGQGRTSGDRTGG